MVAHGKALRAYHHIHHGIAITVHQILAEHRPVVLAQTRAEYRQRIASLPLQRVNHSVHELQIAADPVCAIEQQRSRRLAVIAVQPSILVERRRVQPARAIHAILRQRRRRFIAILAAQNLVAQKSQQVDQIAHAPMVQILESRLRHDRRRSRAPLEHCVAHRLARARHQRNAQPPALRLQRAEALAHRLVAAQQSRQNETRAWQRIAQKPLQRAIIRRQRKRIQRDHPRQPLRQLPPRALNRQYIRIRSSQKYNHNPFSLSVLSVVQFRQSVLPTHVGVWRRGNPCGCPS